MTLEQYQTMLGSGVSGGYEGPFTPGYIGWQGLPGYEAFWREATGNGDNYQEAGLRLPELYQYLDQNKIGFQEDQLPDRYFTRYAVDANGQPIEATRVTGRNDSFGDILKDVGKLAAIMGTAYLGGTALAGSGAGAGTAAAAAAPVTDAATAAFLEANMGALAPGAGASTGLLSQAGGALSSAANWMKANPTAGRLLMSGVSGLLSASGGSSGGSGGYKDSGYRPTISRGNWQASVTPRSMAMTPTSINLPTTGNAGSGLWRYGLLGG